MMHRRAAKLRKIRSNVLSGRACSVLGPALYARYLASLLANAPKILKAGDLRPLDESMGATAKQFRYRGSTLHFDCRYCDERLKENTFAFGIVREIYIRDCYFKWHATSVYDQARTVVDLGANRGAFSTLMTARAEFVLSVDCGEQYAPVIRHNMKKNGYTSYAFETAFVGAGGSAKSNLRGVTIEDLLQKHDMESVDLMKIDVEGSEFALFESADWLRRVRAMSLEVHPLHGDPRAILKSLSEHGFLYTMADEDLRRTGDARQVSFVYAWKDVRS